MRKLNVTLDVTADRMVNALIDHSNRCNPPVSLSGITLDNFNSELDRRFNDGGEARCEHFTDLGWEYSIQFGELESQPFNDRQWAVIKAAIKELANRQ